MFNIFKKSKEPKKIFVVQNLNDLEEFKDDVIILPNNNNETDEEVVLKTTKKLPMEELKEKIKELDSKLEDKVDNKKLKTTNSKTVLMVSTVALLGTLSIGYLGLELNNKNIEINKLNQNLQTLSIVKTDVVETKFDDKEIKELIASIDGLKKEVEVLKNQPKVETKVENKVESLKVEDVNKIILESFKIKEMDEKLVKALEKTDETKDKKIADLMKKLEEANMLMTEVVKKQREEIISLNQKISGIINGEKDKFTLTKDDLNKIAMLETRVLKDSDLLDSLYKQVSKLTEEINNKKLNLLTDKRPIEKNTSVSMERNVNQYVETDSKKELPIFSIYKILNNGQFYLKNRVNGKLLEQAISEKDIIIDRYEVLNVDFANKTIIFKDLEKNTSLTLIENE